MTDPREPAALAEIQGLYGAFSFPERLLQKIWLRGDFHRAALRTLDGREVRIVHPGKWNLLGGPDFTAARLRFGPEFSRETEGDIEVHLHASDWEAHAHARDPAYDRVMLHVVLFPPDDGRPTVGVAGHEIATVVLLPLLHRGLEEFAADEAVEALAHRALARLPEELGRLPEQEREEQLHRHALARWRQKLHFSSIRLDRLGWDEACHHAALEILGYRYNRAPMLRIAGQFRLGKWVDGSADPDALLSREEGNWSVQGVRPANFPRTRLRQYAAWVRSAPDWPDRVRRWGERLRPIEEKTATTRARRECGFPLERTAVAETICGRTISGTRLENVICDGLFPLLASQAAETGDRFFGWWLRWYPGDLPGLVVSGLRQLGYFGGRERPASHGVAQGLLGWLLDRETKVPAAGGAPEVRDVRSSP